MNTVDNYNNVLNFIKDNKKKLEGLKNLTIRTKVEVQIKGKVCSDTTEVNFAEKSRTEGKYYVITPNSLKKYYQYDSLSSMFQQVQYTNKCLQISDPSIGLTVRIFRI